MQLSFRQLKWISIVVPVTALTALLYVAAFALPDALVTPPGFLVAVGVIVSGVMLFSHLVFGFIGRLEQETLRQSDRFATAAGVATRLSQAEGTDEILQNVLDEVAESYAVQTGVVCLLDEQTDELYLCAHRGLPGPLLDRVWRQRVTEDLIGQEVIREVRPVVVADTAQDPRSQGLAENFGLWSFVSVPLIAEGRAIGVLALASTSKARFDEEDVRLLEQIARQLGIAVHRTNLSQQLLARNEELRLLNDVSGEFSRVREEKAIFEAVLASALEVSGAAWAELWLDERGQKVLADTAGHDGFNGETEVADAVNLRQRVWKTAASEISPFANAMLGCFPIQSAGQMFGLIFLRDFSVAVLTPRRRQLLESIADQGAVAISNAQFRVRVRELAVLEERERIAREMHDGLAQVLGYVNTKAFAVRRLLKDGDTAMAQSMLAQLEEAAQEVYADVREGVLALRGTSPGDRSLLDNLCDYLGKFERLSGIHVECHADGKVTDLRLPEMSEIQVTRVIQEALSNVRKHAAAKNVTLTLRVRDGTLVARVDDDGTGFDVRTAGRGDSPQFGLHTMRERAEAVGGRFSVRSTLGKGTHVAIRVPVKGRREMQA